MYGNGCNTASIHGESYTLGQRYIFAENKAAIGFIAASNYSFASSLHVFATMFYRELSAINYHESIGTILKETCDTLWPTFNIFDQLSIEHTTLQGDPALKLNNHEQPDYAIEEQYVFLNRILLQRVLILLIYISWLPIWEWQSILLIMSK